MSDEPEPTAPVEDDLLSIDDIELAYRAALKSMDEAELQVGSALMELADDGDDELEDENAFNSIGNELADDLEAESTVAAVVEEAVTDDGARVSPRSVIEGALFVGGDVSLTARKLASLIGNNTDHRLAVKLIDQLNEDYTAENRPYEIQLHEGGFRMQLREKFANVALKVFGLGPREVRLSPDSLEVLAFVAYNQPVTKDALSQISNKNLQTLLRQLIRLRLVDIERTGTRRSDIAYRTANRFLELFGLDSLDDMPQADVFSFK